jgi:hypothetical protein
MGISITDYETNLKNEYDARQKSLTDKAGNGKDAHAPIYGLIQQYDNTNFSVYLQKMKNARFPNGVETNDDTAKAKEKEVTDNYWKDVRTSVEGNFTTVSDAGIKKTLIDEAFNDVKPTTAKIGEVYDDVVNRIKNPTKETAIDAGGAALGGGFAYWLADLVGVENAFGKFILAIGGMVAGWMITEKLQGGTTASAPVTPTTEGGFKVTGAVDTKAHTVEFEKLIGSETYVIKEQLKTDDRTAEKVISAIKKNDPTNTNQIAASEQGEGLVDIPAGASVGTMLSTPTPSFDKLKLNVTNNIR